MPEQDEPTGTQGSEGAGDPSGLDDAEHAEGADGGAGDQGGAGEEGKRDGGEDPTILKARLEAAETLLRQLVAPRGGSGGGDDDDQPSRHDARTAQEQQEQQEWRQRGDQVRTRARTARAVVDAMAGRGDPASDAIKAMGELVDRIEEERVVERQQLGQLLSQLVGQVRELDSDPSQREELRKFLAEEGGSFRSRAAAIDFFKRTHKSEPAQRPKPRSGAGGDGKPVLRQDVDTHIRPLSRRETAERVYTHQQFDDAIQALHAAGRHAEARQLAAREDITFKD